KLGPKVPPLCQFLEEASADHRVRYRSRKQPSWRLAFDFNGKPRSYCPRGDKACRTSRHAVRNHRQCTKFAFANRSLVKTPLTNRQILEVLHKAHPGQGIKVDYPGYS
ncbi:hypothetical protein BIW11_07607, partial [Tropilaelaps mercedesae]